MDTKQQQQQPPRKLTISSSRLSSSSHSNSSSSRTSSQKQHQQQQFHRRQITNSSIPSLPKPSHKPPSTSNDFRGDLKSQDVFAAAFKKRNDKLRVLFPGMDRFEMERMDMWNHDSICTPCLIIQPKSNKEVSDALTGYTYGVLKCLSANRKQNAQLVIPRLTIAGGRNSINAMRDGCIVLDMSRMRSIKVNTSTKECKIQGGVRVVDLDATLSEYGYVAMSSIYQNMGVVGTILSGGFGFGYASRKFGLACDNVLEAEVILADGRLKRCSKVQHTDLFYSLCGGGGGFGVVVSVTLRCFPLLNAALLTYDIPTSYKHEDVLNRRRTILKHWGNWLHGDLDDDDDNRANANVNANDKNSKRKSQPLSFLRDHDGVNDEVFSQIIIPTKYSQNIQFIATSIDETAVPQVDGFIEQYEEAERKSKRSARGLLSKLKRSGSGGNSNSCSGGCGEHVVSLGLSSSKSFKQYASTADEMKQYGWDRTPGLADLISNKFGASTRNHVQFRMTRYADQLQSHSSEYSTSGNVYIATKYAHVLTKRIIEILVQATLGEFSPNNESKIYVHSLGGEIGNMEEVHNFSFNSRYMNYAIFIEGRWEAVAEQKYAKEKKKVTKWVNWVVNQLHLAEGIQSTSHPESTRDQVSKSGRSKPPSGWYNFDEISGKKLMAIKQKRDPKNVFSLSSRISWLSGGSQSLNTPNLSEKSNNNGTALNKSVHSSSLSTPVKDGEIDPTDCLTPKTILKPNLMTAIIESLSSPNDVEDCHDFDNDVELDDLSTNIASMDGSKSEDEDSMGSDLKRLLTISDSDEEFKDWSFTENDILGNSNFDLDKDGDRISPKSAADFDPSF